MKIVVDNKIPFIGCRLVNMPATDVVFLPPSEITREKVTDADALVVRTRTRCDAALLEGSKVRLVTTATIGTDHIDLPWCAANGIKVENAAGCNAPGVAQYVWSSLIRNCIFEKGYTPKIGVVGLGHVGSIVADWGHRLGAEILVCDPPRNRMGVDREDYLPLETLLKECDALTLHVPLTKDGDDATFHLIGKNELVLMKSGSVLVNTSRGSVVNNSDWMDHLKDNADAKAIIDVWEGEPNINRELLDRATIATPHIAGYSYEGKQRATRMALESLNRFFGMEISTDGLCVDYNPSEMSFPPNFADIIKESYNPYTDDSALRANPGAFEKLRSDYDYRHEPK